MTNPTSPDYLEIISTLTTTITAVFSVFIAYKSHKTTIKQKELDKKEASSKIIRKFKRNTELIRTEIMLLTLGSEKYRRKSGLDETINIAGTVENLNLIEKLNKYVEETRKILDTELNTLTVEDEKKLVRMIDRTHNLRNELSFLKNDVKKLKDKNKLTIDEIRKHEIVQKSQDSIAEKANELLEEI